MDFKLYQLRLKSFKDNLDGKKKQRWNPKIPSMVSFARSFFKFDPTPEEKDRVTCTECDLNLSDWIGMRTYPIRKHSGLNTHCFVAELGDLCAQLSEGASVDFLHLATICFKTFEVRLSKLTPISRKLAAKGFIYLPLNEINIETVGCISCLCYPQLGLKNPQHSRNCPIPKIIDNTQDDIKSIFILGGESVVNNVNLCPKLQLDHTELSGIPNNGKLDGTPYHKNYSKLEDAPIVEIPLTIDTNRVNNYATFDKDILRLASSVLYANTCDSVCIDTFELAKVKFKAEISSFAKDMQNGFSTELASLELAEEAIIRVLEMSHAQRISIISNETERIILKLINEGNCYEKV